MKNETDEGPRKGTSIEIARTCGELCKRDYVRAKLSERAIEVSVYCNGSDANGRTTLPAPLAMQWIARPI